jgi:hypothetical protein
MSITERDLVVVGSSGLAIQPFTEGRDVARYVNRGVGETVMACTALSDANYCGVFRLMTGQT